MKGAVPTKRVGQGGARKRRAPRSSFVAGRFVYADEVLPLPGAEGAESVENDYCKVDAPLDWDKVCCVASLSSQTCPVCLDDPAVAPWMLPGCGHVFCSACLRQLRARKTEKCVVCQGEFLHWRPARFAVLAHPFVAAVGSTVELALCVRRKDLSVVLPFAEFVRRSELGISFERLPLASTEASKFTRFVVGREADEVSRELQAIEQHLAVIEKDELELEGLTYWIEAREECLSRLEKARLMHGTAREVELEGVGAERGAAADPNDFVFFYTCEAEHVFFCGFVMKMLMHQAEQDPFKLPEKVTCKIQDVETFSRDEKSPKFLAHLPHGCKYSFVEGIVSHLNKETIKVFRDEINLRSRQRKQRLEKAKARDEKFQANVRSRLQQQAKYQGQPVSHMLMYDEMIPAAPHVVLVEEEIRFKPEKKFLSYAAVASPDGQSFNALSSSSSISPPLKSESRAPSFADKVKSGGKMESSSPTNSDNSELEFKAKGKRGAKFVVLTGGGGRTIN